MVARRGSRATSRSASSRPWALTARRSCSPATARMRSRRSPRSRRRCRSPGSCCRSREPEFRGATARALRGSAFPCYMGGSAAPPIAGRSNPVSVRSVAVAAVAVLLSPPRSASAQATAPLYDSTVFAALNWREIGIFRGGRSVAVAGSASRPNEYWFGTVGGGVFKSTDGGNTWLPMSDKYFGGTNGAKTWTFVGLAETQQISRVRVHLKNPEVVYVGAQGHAYGPNPERGVYKTTDGGKTWNKVLFRGDSTGIADLMLDPSNPDVIYAAFWPAHHLPERRVDHVRGGRLEHQVSDSGRIAAKQHLVPRLAAVGRLVDAALGIGAVGVALRADVHDLGILEMHPHARDLLRLGEADERPGLAAVGGLPHAVAVRDVAADRVLAGADVDDVGVRLAHADRADGAAEVLVGHRQPSVAPVGALEHATAHRAEPVLVGPGRGARHRHAAAAAEDPDLAPVERGEDGRVVKRGGGLGRRGTRRGEQDGDGGYGDRANGHGVRPPGDGWSGGATHVARKGRTPQGPCGCASKLRLTASATASR